MLYYDRFVELGMGLTGIVNVALGRIESSTKIWLEIIDRVNKGEDLEDRIKSSSDTLLSAESKALEVYKGVKAWEFRLVRVHEFQGLNVLFSFSVFKAHDHSSA